MAFVDGDHERTDGDHDGGEGGTGGDHEHDDHLEFGGLLDGGTAEDGAGHHSGNGDYAEDAWGSGEVVTGMFVVNGKDWGHGGGGVIEG